jgi:hypothetical protein
VIEYRELLLLLRDSNQLDAIESLVTDGLSAFTTDGDAISGLITTPAGAAKLNGMLLPLASE